MVPVPTYWCLPAHFAYTVGAEVEIVETCDADDEIFGEVVDTEISEAPGAATDTEIGDAPAAERKVWSWSRNQEV